MARKTDAFERRRRFYKAVDTAPDGDGFAVRLDGRIPKTPAGARLILPNARLADLVAAEWAGQDEVIDFHAMPATRLAFTALDAVPLHRKATAAEVARYAGTDLICYFADHPRKLIERQEAGWQPLLRWAHETLGLEFVRGQGIVHAQQPPATIAAVERIAESLDDVSLAGLAFGAGLFGSVVIALALQRGHINGDDAFRLSRIDETFQEEQWGVDAEAAARADAVAVDAVMLERWFAALR